METCANVFSVTQIHKLNNKIIIDIVHSIIKVELHTVYRVHIQYIRVFKKQLVE